MCWSKETQVGKETLDLKESEDHRGLLGHVEMVSLEEVVPGSAEATNKVFSDRSQTELVFTAE